MATDIRYTRHGREVTVSGFCERSGRIYQVTITEAQYRNWKGGKPLRQAMPFLSPEQILFVREGITPEEAKPYDEVTK